MRNDFFTSPAIILVSVTAMLIASGCGTPMTSEAIVADEALSAATNNNTGGSGFGTGNCCVASDRIEQRTGCNVSAVEACVCDRLPRCCNDFWGPSCVLAAADTCGGCPNLSSEANPASSSLRFGQPPQESAAASTQDGPQKSLQQRGSRSQTQASTAETLQPVRCSIRSDTTQQLPMPKPEPPLLFVAADNASSATIASDVIGVPQPAAISTSMPSDRAEPNMELKLPDSLMILRLCV